MHFHPKEYCYVAFCELAINVRKQQLSGTLYGFLCGAESTHLVYTMFPQGKKTECCLPSKKNLFSTCWYEWNYESLQFLPYYLRSMQIKHCRVGDQQ